MVTVLLRRVGQSVAVLLVMAILAFLAIYAIGNPVDVLVSPEADQMERQAAMARLGLDQPLAIQFLSFVGRLAHGDLGTSFVHGAPALGLVLERLPATLELAVTAMITALLIGLPLGLWAGLSPGGIVGRAIAAFSILGFCLPTFWVGLVLIMTFSVHFGWLPAGGRGITVPVAGISLGILSLDGLAHLLLPAANLALFKTSLIIRLASAGTRNVARQDYIRFARAKGLSSGRIIGVHILKNIMIPIVTVLGMELGSVIAFSVVTESIFAWPGMGKLLIDSIVHLDRPVVVAYLLVIVLVFMVINLLVDLLYAALDPRIGANR
ncbi:MAG: ABC transporter permease [Azospirillaceae bacterium]|nr:ABC transporter permease [Azospirillaceae bacterium]